VADEEIGARCGEGVAGKYRGMEVYMGANEVERGKGIPFPDMDILILWSKREWMGSFVALSCAQQLFRGQLSI
jgi:hypothetical protein